MLRIKLSLVTVLALCSSGLALAGTITYDVSGTVDDAGAPLTISGNFVYDDVTNAVTNWDLEVSGSPSAPFCGRPVPCYVFEPGTGASASFTPDLFQFVGPDSNNYTETLRLIPTNSSSPLPTATYNLVGPGCPNANSSDSSTICSLLFSTSGTQPPTYGDAFFTSGTLTPESSTAVTPEPATVEVLFGALLFFVALGRRRIIPRS